MYYLFATAAAAAAIASNSNKPLSGNLSMLISHFERDFMKINLLFVSGTFHLLLGYECALNVTPKKRLV